MNTRALLAIALSVAVALAGVGVVAGVGDSVAGLDHAVTDADADDAPRNAAQDYEVSIDNVTISTWLLRDSTVQNATVEEVRIRNATTPEGTRENVTLENVTVGEFVIDRGRLQNVTAKTLVVRNRSVLDVPGGEFFDPDVRDRTIDRQWTQNQTVSGVVIDTIVVDAATMEENASLGSEAEDPEDFSPTAGEDRPDIDVENGTVGEALVIDGEANDWSVESVSEDAAEQSDDGESDGDGEDDADGEDDGDEDGEDGEDGGSEDD
ncbi:hypothetical protein NGM10_15020 [Halorussus salilacus]|uniref:hypothetical protein n=1 Tax=Halorussus salilacus TaxID=2953750 RepID=UPI00209EDDCA|nr:hypothetical protein [Halorussus salilacus]USZ68031.1 hypothetical protein NGM10_15020 [Halorussus salilacus]